MITFGGNDKLVRHKETTVSVQWYDWCSTMVRLVRYNGMTGAVQGDDWYDTRATTGTEKWYDWYGARVRLVRYGYGARVELVLRKGAAGTVQGYDWYGARTTGSARVRLVAQQGYDWTLQEYRLARCNHAIGTAQQNLIRVASCLPELAVVCSLSNVFVCVCVRLGLVAERF